MTASPCTDETALLHLHMITRRHLFAVCEFLFHPPKPEDQRYGKTPDLQGPLQQYHQNESCNSRSNCDADQHGKLLTS